MFGVLHCTPYWQNFSYITVEVFLFGKKFSLFARYTSIIYQIGEMLSKRAIIQCLNYQTLQTYCFSPCLLREIWLDSLKSQDTSCKYTLNQPRGRGEYTNRILSRRSVHAGDIFYRVLLVVHIDVSNLKVAW